MRLGRLGRFASAFGLVNPAFAPNPAAAAGREIHDRFVRACRELPEFATLAVAFHGTYEDNVETILRDGLDPKKRQGQAYGPGEYFSTDPGVSTSYCRRRLAVPPPAAAPQFGGQPPSQQGLKMLVFLVVRPLPKEDSKPDPSKPNPPSRTHIANQQNNCPPHYVVVPTTEHQLPLGVLSFDRVEPAALRRADAMRAKLQQLNQQIKEQEHQANKARVKAKIIQKIILGELDVAAEHYRRNRDYLCSASKREISKFAHTKYDADFVVFYFPDLPDPMTAEEEDRIVSVEALERDVEQRKKELEEQRCQNRGNW